jgi:(p)ppGpp synthase/HD superfamily hydrolase
MKPLRLVSGSIPADFAALRDIDVLDKDYKGAAVYTVEYDINENKLILSPKRVRSDRYCLQPGEIVDILTSPNFLLRSSKARDTIKNNAKNLRTHLILSNLILAQLEKISPQECLKKSAEAGKEILKQAGLRISDYALKKFLRPFALQMGLRNESELLAALALTDKISAQHLIDYARSKGGQLLEGKGLNLNDEIVLEKLRMVLGEFSQESIDGLLIAIGSLQVKVDEVYERLSSKRIPTVISPEVVDRDGRGIYYFEIICPDKIGLMADITKVFKDLEIDIIGDIKLERLEAGKCRLTLRIRLKNYEQVGRVFEGLKQNLEIVESINSHLESLKACGRRFLVKILAEDRIGLTYDITKAITGLGINIFEFSSPSKEGDCVSYSFILEAPSTINREDIRKALEDLPNVAAEVESLNASDKDSSAGYKWRILESILRDEILNPLSIIGNFAKRYE